MRSRLTIALTAIVVACSAGGAVALNGGFSTQSGNAATAQYGINGQNGQNGNNGQNGQNGNNGQNGQNGVNGGGFLPAPVPPKHKPSARRKRELACRAAVLKAEARRRKIHHFPIRSKKRCWW